MNQSLEDTIAAVVTPVGEGGISVIRVSGPDSLDLADKIFFPVGKVPVKKFKSHTVHFGEVRSDEGVCLDQVLVTYFQKPRSYTGEDSVEISLHGGVAITRRLLDLILKQGARMAEPGEFTKRAFLNGRLDLTQAEAVVDLIKAKSERSIEVAAGQLRGLLSGKFKVLRDELMRMAAHMEAYLDFPEEDIEVYSDQAFIEKFAWLEKEIRKWIQSFKRGVLLREGIACAIVGKPNVGKSSLFNALLERDRALVSEHPGTTRDQLEESVEIGGIYIRLIDTAGLFHRSDHPLDQMGMDRTRCVLRDAGLILFVLDGSRPLGKEDEEIFSFFTKEKRILVLINKSDLPSRLDPAQLKKFAGEKNSVRISAKSRDGIDELERKVTSLIEAGGFDSEGGEQITRLRHKVALEQALAALTRSEQAFRKRESLEFVVLELKSALDQLRELIGEIYTEDLLDVIFSEFCLGK